LPVDIEVYSIQIPRREGRPWEPLFHRLEPLIQTFARTLEPYLDMPYAFFGHSLGALIGFELIRTLSREGVPSPLHLFVSAHAAPQLQDSCRMLHQLSDSDLMREIRQLNGTPAEILESDELMTLFLPALRADIAINETYVYTPALPLHCPISAFGGWQDGIVSHESLAAWRDQTYGPFSLRMFPGDHFFLHGMQKSLLHALTRDLTQSMSPPYIR
jgi:surfactin synthase thioesterase subunit